MTTDEQQIEHPFVKAIAKDFDIDTNVEKALYIITKREFPEIYPHMSVFAATRKSNKYKLASIKYMHHDPVLNLFTTCNIILTTSDLCQFYGEEEPHWYDAVTQKTIKQYLKIIPEDSEELFAQFSNYLMRFGQQNKYKYASILFNLITASSLGTAWASSANKMIIDKNNQSTNAAISGTTQDATKEEK